jgi:hypothetical protein
MQLLDLLKGKKMMVQTDMKVTVEMEIKEVIEENHSVETGPSTRENDWWPPTENWKTYTVKFTNGASKTFNSLSEINVH